MLLAAASLYFSLRGVQWSQVWGILRNAHVGYIALPCAIGSGNLFLRAFRWRVLLQARASVNTSTVFWATCVGYFGNVFLPARAGEVIRVMMVSAGSSLTKTFVVTTAVSERLSDALTLVVISAVILLMLPVRPGWISQAATPFAIAGLGGALTIALLPKLNTLWLSLIERLLLPRMLKVKLLEIFEQILIGIGAFHNAGRLLRFAGLTGAIWLLDAIGSVVVMRSLDFHLSLAVAFLLITGLGLGSALPSTPGYVGIYQFVAVSVLTPFGFTRTDAIAYILLVQALQYVLTAFWGVLGLLYFRSAKQKFGLRPECVQCEF